MTTDPLRPPAPVIQREISKAARALERDKARRRKAQKHLAQLDELIRDRARVLRALIADATEGVDTTPPAPADHDDVP